MPPLFGRSVRPLRAAKSEQHDGRGRRRRNTRMARRRHTAVFIRNGRRRYARGAGGGGEPIPLSAVAEAATVAYWPDHWAGGIKKKKKVEKTERWGGGGNEKTTRPGGSLWRRYTNGPFKIRLIAAFSVACARPRRRPLSERTRTTPAEPRGRRVRYCARPHYNIIYYTLCDINIQEYEIWLHYGTRIAAYK